MADMARPGNVTEKSAQAAQGMLLAQHRGIRSLGRCPAGGGVRAAREKSASQAKGRRNARTRAPGPPERGPALTKVPCPTWATS